MKMRCGSVVDPISLEDWCEIPPALYVRPGVINDRQCYNLSSLITAINARLSARFAPLDPTTNLPLTDDQLLILAAQYVNAGYVLPIDIHLRVKTIMDFIDDPRVREVHAILIGHAVDDFYLREIAADIVEGEHTFNYIRGNLMELVDSARISFDDLRGLTVLILNLLTDSDGYMDADTDGSGTEESTDGESEISYQE
jgi:hypothetical protein